VNEKQMPRSGCVHIGAKYRYLVLAGDEEYAGLTMQTAFTKFAAKEAEARRAVDARDKREFFRGWRAGKAQYAIRHFGYLMPYLNAEELEQLGEDLYGMARSWGAITVDYTKESP
jgi:hypothetical protein